MEQDSGWLDVLFAAECLNKSALGLTRQDTKGWPQAVRDAYTKLSAGHVSSDLFEKNFDIPIPVDGAEGICEQTRGKIARTAYWLQQLREGRNGVLDRLPRVDGAEINPDAEHPRIFAAVKEIEHWIQQHEKVLVFGVFLQPLKLLRDVLNVRHALRAADEGRPIAHAIDPDPALLGIAVRQLDRLRAEGALNGRLKTANRDEMLQTLRDSCLAYSQLRKKVRERAEKVVKAWRSDKSLLGGVLNDSEIDKALQNLLIDFTLDDALTKGSESNEIIGERFDELAREFVSERLSPLLGEPGKVDDGDENQAKRQKVLQPLKEDVDIRQSLHARLLKGKTPWETRRYLQAAFNRPGTSPRVLIAQSQVGREGLNLHEACRVVVQFHAEWNPAILEQQIGRVDRKGSRWEQMAQEWLKSAPSKRDVPYIEVRQLLFDGTYDTLQWERVGQRQVDFDASLFGSLLPPEDWARISDEGIRRRLIEAAPDFSPTPKRESRAK